MAQRLVLSLVADERLSLDPSVHAAAAGDGFEVVLKVLDLPTLFKQQRLQRRQKRGSNGTGVSADAAQQAAAAVEEEERTQWPVTLRDYNVDHPANKVSTSSGGGGVNSAASDGEDNACRDGRGRGRHLSEGGRKKVYKVYNCRQRRWEAALVIAQPRCTHRTSALRIRSGLAEKRSLDGRPRPPPFHPISKSKSHRKSLRSCETQIVVKPSSRRQAISNSLISEYDREIFALAKCSQVVCVDHNRHTVSAQPVSSSSSGSTIDCTVLSSAESAGDGFFPHFLRVFSIAPDVLRPADTLWPNVRILVYNVVHCSYD